MRYRWLGYRFVLVVCRVASNWSWDSCSVVWSSQSERSWGITTFSLSWVGSGGVFDMFLWEGQAPLKESLGGEDTKVCGGGLGLCDVLTWFRPGFLWIYSMIRLWRWIDTWWYASGSQINIRILQGIGGLVFFWSLFPFFGWVTSCYAILRRRFGWWCWLGLGLRRIRSSQYHGSICLESCAVIGWIPNKIAVRLGSEFDVDMSGWLWCSW